MTGDTEVAPRTRQVPLPSFPTLSITPPREGRGSLSPTKPHKPLSDVDLLAELAMTIALQYGKVTADDLRNLAPAAPRKTSNFGAAFQKLVRENRLVLSHYQASQKGANHGRRIGVYVPRVKAVNACP